MKHTPRGPLRYSNGRRALWISGAYAVLVIGTALFVFVASRASGGMAAVWLVLVTLPFSVLSQFIPGEGKTYIIILTAGGLVQAVLLWALLRGKKVR
ncbi:SCO4225 family membrane protein [Streptomyces sp. BK79]|uniref:SCO4225 family membrane protein n=1 Tax=Streptomyces sp. BK79 TaxID=3350097 RepID=UPI0037705CA3